MSRRSRPRPGALAVALAAAVAVAGCGSGPTASPGSPGTSPGPSATAAASAVPSYDGQAIAAAFVRILADPALRATVVQQATATSEQAGDIIDVRVTMTGDLALPDVSLQLAIETEGRSTRFGVIVVGPRAFADLGEGWIEAPASSVDTTDLVSGFVVVTDPRDLAYAGTGQVDGRELHHLVASRPLPYVPAGFEGTDAGTGTLDDLDAYVEADGTPVRIELSFTAEGTTEGVPVRVTGTTEIRFSDVGGGQVIVAPSLAPTPTASP